MNNYNATVREAGSFAGSLLNENYAVVFSYADTKRQSAFIKLKHRLNGNVIKVKVAKDRWQAFKNDKRIK